MTKEEIFLLAEKADLYLASDDSVIKFAKLIAEKSKQEQGELVAWFRKENGENIYYATKAWDDCLPLYTKPQTKEWVSLTETQIDKLEKEFIGFPVPNIYNFVKAIEAKLKEKNNIGENN